MITIRKQLTALWNKTFYTSGKNEKGQEDAEALHVCIHEGIVGKATSLQLYVLGSFFPSLSFDLTIIPLKEVEAPSPRSEYFAS